MKLSEFKRVKHGQLPGDISKYEKIAMRERKHPDKFLSKVYRKEVDMKTKGANRERARREIQLGELEMLTG